MRAKKRLGQHFLTDSNIARKIVSSLKLDRGDHVLEIGPGRGDLTIHLVATGARIAAVEFDRDLVAQLADRFGSSENFKLIESDILKFDPRSNVPENSTTLVGNLPYNITSPILEWLIDHCEFFPRAVIMVQREVADRISALPGSKDFGSLTIFVQIYFRTSKLFDVQPGCFKPVPKVHSTVIQLDRRKSPLVSPGEFVALRRLTSACFRWRRKQIIRILRDEYSISPSAIERVLTSLEISPKSRPEQLAVELFVALSRRLSSLDLDQS